MPFATGGPAKHYDPLKIDLASDCSFLENVFSPLVEYSPEAELVSGLASKFEWIGAEARFTFRPGVRTVDGFAIDAYDAELTFKRLFLKGDAKYAFMRDLLCPGKGFNTIGDDCPGLEVRKGGSELVMKFGGKKTYLFPMLTSVYFGIIPRRSLDLNTLEITDYRNTSGPYYVGKELPDGTMELYANKSHYRYSASMPRKASLFPIKEFGNDYLLGLLSQKKGDYLLFDIARYPDVKSGYAAKNKDFRLHLTYPIRGVYVIFTPRGLRRLSLAERLFIGKKLRESFLRLHPGYEVPDQIFTMEGGLTRVQLAQLRSLMAAVPESGVISKPLTAWRLFNYFTQEKEAVLKWLPKVESVGSSQLPGFVDYAKTGLSEPDFYIAGSDIGLQEDVGLLSYFLDLEFFNIPQKEKKEWLKLYVNSSDKEARMEMLRSLQYKTLISGAVIPLTIHPYAALVRGSWDFSLPKMNTSNPIWRLRAR